MIPELGQFALVLALFCLWSRRTSRLHWLVVAGFVVLTQLSSGGEDPADKCAGATMESLR